MTTPPRLAAVLTVSDSAHNGTRTDGSGPAVAARLEDAGFAVTARRIVPDDRARIATELRELATTLGIGLICTTGGTGVALRDVTPEATRDVIDREVPGFVELMRSEGLKQTRFAPLSRAVSGTYGKVLIVNLPGSPAGAVQSLDAIVELVPHVLDLLGGHTEHQRAGYAAKDDAAKD